MKVNLFRESLSINENSEIRDAIALACDKIVNTKTLGIDSLNIFSRFPLKSTEKRLSRCFRLFFSNSLYNINTNVKLVNYKYKVYSTILLHK